MIRNPIRRKLQNRLGLGGGGIPVVVVGVDVEEHILLASSSHSGRCRRMDLLDGMAIIRRRRVRDDMLCARNDERRSFLRLCTETYRTLKLLDCPSDCDYWILNP